MSDDLWIFGYGSLIFKADFPFQTRQPATLPAWQRRFWQASTDHRGTPHFPGRVVTLVADPAEECWGMAYQIAERDVDDVLDHLDYREKGGYCRLETTLKLSSGPEVPALTYLADEQNPEYLGHAPMAAMALQIAKASGPSGQNRDYLFELEKSLRAHGIIDEHVFELADSVRKLLPYQASRSGA